MSPSAVTHARIALRRLRGAELSTHAAAVAYNAFLGLVPLTVALVGIAGLIGGDAAAVGRVERALAPIAPQAVTDFVTSIMIDADTRLGDGQVWLVALGGLVALFLGSRAVAALQRSLALLEGEVEARPALQMRLVATGLTVAGGVAMLATSLLLVGGRFVFAFIGELIRWEGVTALWAWLRVPVAGLGLFAFLLAFYRLGPPEPLPRARLAALVGVSGIVLTSLGFGLYLAAAPILGATFGILGAVAIALVWLYLGALSILAGGVTAYAVEQANRSSGDDDEPTGGGLTPAGEGDDD